MRAFSFHTKPVNQGPIFFFFFSSPSSTSSFPSEASSHNTARITIQHSTGRENHHIDFFYLNLAVLRQHTLLIGAAAKSIANIEKAFPSPSRQINERTKALIQTSGPQAVLWANASHHKPRRRGALEQLSPPKGFLVLRPTLGAWRGWKLPSPDWAKIRCSPEAGKVTARLNADGSPTRAVRGHRHDLVLYNQGGGSKLMDGAESLDVSLSHFI